MNEEAKLELELRFRFFELYLNTSMKGLAFFIALQGALLTLAARDRGSQEMFSVAALIMCISTLIPLHGSLKVLKKMEGHFERLAAQTGTALIELRIAWVFWLGTLTFWALSVVGWICLYFTAK